MTEKIACTARHINHVCIAVRDIEEALTFYQDTFGIGEAEIVDVPHEGMKATHILIGSTRLEFIEPTDPKGHIARFIERRGEAVHHICFEVDNLQEKLDILDARGLELLDKKPRMGLVGLVAFIHPRSTRGVLIELVERGPSQELSKFGGTGHAEA